MKEVEKADKKWLCILYEIPYEAYLQGAGTASAALYIRTEPMKQIIHRS